MAYLSLVPAKPIPIASPVTYQFTSSSKKIVKGLFSSFDPQKHIIIGIVGPDYNDLGSLYDKRCPFCDAYLISIDVSKRRCMSCHQYLKYLNESIEDVCMARWKAGVYTGDIDIKEGSVKRSIYSYHPPTKTHFIHYLPPPSDE